MGQRPELFFDLSAEKSFFLDSRSENRFFFNSGPKITFFSISGQEIVFYHKANNSILIRVKKIVFRTWAKRNRFFSFRFGAEKSSLFLRLWVKKPIFSILAEKSTFQIPGQEVIFFLRMWGKRNFDVFWFCAEKLIFLLQGQFVFDFGAKINFFVLSIPGQKKLIA